MPAKMISSISEGGGKETRSKNGYLRRIFGLLRHHRFHHTDEKGLQDGIEKVFCENGIAFHRERKLSGDSGRIDFYLPEVSFGLEVKVGGGHSETARQVHRYMKCPELDGLIIVTTRKKHGLLAGEILDKPVHVVCLWLRAF